MKTLGRFRDWSIRWKLAVLLAVAAVLPVALEGLLVVRSARSLIREYAVALLNARGDEIAERLDSFHRSYLKTSELCWHVCQCRRDLRCRRPHAGQES